MELLISYSPRDDSCYLHSVLLELQWSKNVYSEDVYRWLEIHFRQPDPHCDWARVFYSMRYWRECGKKSNGQMLFRYYVAGLLLEHENAEQCLKYIKKGQAEGEMGSIMALTRDLRLYLYNHVHQ